MKKGLIIGVILAGALVGCGSSSKEIVMKDDIKEDSKKKVVVEYIENKNNDDLTLKQYKNGEVYGLKLIEEHEKQDGDIKDEIFNLYYSDSFYKITKDNKIEKASGEKPEAFSRDFRDKGVIFKRNGNKDAIEKVYYVDENKKITKELKEFKEPLKMDDIFGIHGGLVKGTEKYAFYEITEEKNSLIAIEGAPTWTEKTWATTDLQVFNVENGEILELDEKLKRGETAGIIFYSEGFYFLTEDYKLYKLKDIDKTLIIEKTINLSKEFGFEPSYYKEMNSMSIKENVITIRGEEKKSEKHLNEVIVTYDVETGEKKKIKTDILKEYKQVMSRSENSFFILQDRELKENSNNEYIIAEIRDDEIKIIDKFKIEAENFETTRIYDMLVSEDGKELMVCYSNDKKNKDSQTGYLRVKIK